MLQFSKLKKIFILLICFGGLYLSSPNFFSESWIKEQPILPQNQLRLGLDLQGGIHLLLELDQKTIIKQMQDEIIDYTRSVFRRKRLAFTDLRVEEGIITNGIAAVSVNVRDATKVEEIFNELRDNPPNYASSSTNLLFSANNPLFRAELANSDIDNQNRILLFINPAALSSKIQQSVDLSIEVIRRRVDELGTNEPVIQRSGIARILVQLPGAKNHPELGKTAKLTFHTVHETISANRAKIQGVPPGYALFPLKNQPGRSLLLLKRATLGGEHLIDAQPSIDQTNGEVVVNFRLDVTGGSIFRRLTSENIGKPLAIVIDDIVISAPIIQATIQSSGVITGNFTTEEAKNLSILLRAGALPVPLITLEERAVGPSLGADSVQAGAYAGIIGFLAVGVFIIINYRLMGIFAFLSLIINLSLIIGILSALQATLTLPGIAGIVLTIGMAVDANVLIFERIKEEAKGNVKIVLAMEAGYQKAFATILDANITTLIAAIALVLLGAGPIRGFAITLSIGIITSVFTACMLTRLMTITWYKYKRPKNLGL